MKLIVHQKIRRCAVSLEAQKFQVDIQEHFVNGLDLDAALLDLSYQYFHDNSHQELSFPTIVQALFTVLANSLTVISYSLPTLNTLSLSFNLF